MPIALHTIASSLHRGLPDARTEKFITDIEQALGEKFLFCGDDFSSYGTAGCSVIYVRTGGTEGIFRNLGLKGEIRLLTSGCRNSLAAAMEILSFVNKNGGRGEILHGDAEYIASRLRGQDSAKADDCSSPAGAKRWLKELPKCDFAGARLGVIGRPSDWLISSDVDYVAAREKLGLELVDIDIDELVALVRKSDCDLRSFAGSEAVYDALKQIVAKYRLSGLTLRCFDLLDSIGNTGCLALARLNSEGIPSSCEGDVPALITMMLAQKLCGCPGFQCNLSRITGDELLFAHCTVPLSMVRSFKYDTHFESGIGTAVKGEIPEGEVTILKVAPDLSCIAEIPGEIVCNRSEPDLCRTQIVVKAPGAAEYFLRSPLANHHVVVPKGCS